MSQDDFDLEKLKLLKELLAQRFDELVETYLADCAARVAAIARALEVGDLDTVCLQAHGLRGSSRNIGATAVARLCAILEEQSRAGSLLDGQRQLSAIEQGIAVVSAILRSHL